MQQGNRLGGDADNGGQVPQSRRRQTRQSSQQPQPQQQLIQQQQQPPQRRKAYVTSSKAFGLGIVASIGVTLIAGGGLVFYSMIRDSSVTNYVDAALKEQKQMLQEQQAVVNLSPTSDTMKKVTEPNANITVTRVNKAGETETVSGAGVIIRSDGAILTNEHVVKDAKSIKVTIGGIEYDADYLHGDASSDLAVILCEGAKNLPTVEFGDSTALYQGQYVMSIGNPYGLNDTLSTGTVSSLGRDILYRDGVQEIMYANMIQTDTSTNPGNSGGGLFNEKGELVGIMTIIATDGTSDVNSKANSKGDTKNSNVSNANSNDASDGKITDATAQNENDNENAKSNENQPGNENTNNENTDNIEQQGYSVLQQDSNAKAGSTGIAYAIPASYAKSIAKNLLNDKDGAHASLGLSIDDVPDDTVTKFGLKSSDGAIVTNIVQSGPAQIAGLTNDDVITTFNGIKVVNAQDLQFKVRALPINTEVELKVLREGKEMTFKIRLGSDAS